MESPGKGISTIWGSELRRKPKWEDQTHLVHEKNIGRSGVNVCQGCSNGQWVTPGRKPASAGKPDESGLTKNERKFRKRQSVVVRPMRGRTNPPGKPEDSGSRESPIPQG